MKPMTAAMGNILKALKTRGRGYHGYWVLQSYDGRAWNGLFDRGLLGWATGPDGWTGEWRVTDAGWEA